MLAEKFNTFLLKLTSHFHPLSGDVLTDPTPVPAEFLVLEYHAYKALLTIKLNKSSGPDLVSSRIWKEFALELAPVVSHLYNCSMEEGCVPIILKESIVTPTPTVIPPKVMEEDLRPITLTSPLAKVMEGFTLDLLISQTLGKLDIKQFSVSPKSTTYALVYILHSILEA